MPTSVIQAFRILKKSAAIVNLNFGLDPTIGKKKLIKLKQ